MHTNLLKTAFTSVYIKQKTEYMLLKDTWINKQSPTDLFSINFYFFLLKTLFSNVFLFSSHKNNILKSIFFLSFVFHCSIFPTESGSDLKWSFASERIGKRKMQVRRMRAVNVSRFYGVVNAFMSAVRRHL